jgi:hypothetical protein
MSATDAAAHAQTIVLEASQTGYFVLSIVVLCSLASLIFSWEEVKSTRRRLRGRSAQEDPGWLAMPALASAAGAALCFWAQVTTDASQHGDIALMHIGVLIGLCSLGVSLIAVLAIVVMRQRRVRVAHKVGKTRA